MNTDYNANPPIRVNHGEVVMPAIYGLALVHLAGSMGFAIAALVIEDAPIWALLGASAACFWAAVLAFAISAIGRAIIAGSLSMQRLEREQSENTKQPAKEVLEWRQQ